MRQVLLGLEWYFAAVLGVAGLAKARHPERFVATMRRHHVLPGWAIVAGAILAVALISCAGSEAPTPKATPAASLAVTPIAGPTAARVPSPVESDARVTPCRLTDGGQITGQVLHAGEPAPEGTWVSLVFEGGPTQSVQVRDGRYALPLLAQECPDGLRWVPFTLWAGGQGQAVHRDRADYRLDLGDRNDQLAGEAADVVDYGCPDVQCTIKPGRLAVAPRLPVYHSRGVAYAHVEECDRAVADYEVCLRICPESAGAIKNRGIAYEAQGRLREALADYELFLHPIADAPGERRTWERATFGEKVTALRADAS